MLKVAPSATRDEDTMFGITWPGAWSRTWFFQRPSRAVPGTIFVERKESQARAAAREIPIDASRSPSHGMHRKAIAVLVR